MIVQAIETIHNGVRFRSRQEARWVIVLDGFAVQWRYECDDWRGFFSENWGTPHEAEITFSRAKSARF